ncbi:MAG: TonB-dependent receptor plug domain-containing protein [Niabella sp.]
MHITKATLLFICLAVGVNNTSLLAQNNSESHEKTGTVPVITKTDATGIDTMRLKSVEFTPYISLQQLIKGNNSGVFVQEPSGEPGVKQNMFIHGISAPLLDNKALYEQQPVVYLDGIPLTQEHPFAYLIQKYSINRIGSGTNNLANFNIDNIQSIEVIKDPARLAGLGPLASNGAIWVTTKNPVGGRVKTSVNLYSGVVTTPAYTPINARYEYNFRNKFYNQFGTYDDRLRMPAYLRDSTNADYYGAANWGDLYYNNTTVLNGNASVAGGGEKANFRLFIDGTKDANSADNTSLSKFNGAFYINVVPVEWLTVSSMINYNRINRVRNRNISDRISELRYVPDLTSPLTPNKRLYGAYLDEFDKVIDRNLNNVFQSYVSFQVKADNFYASTKLGIDYNEGTRDVFWPSTLLERVNYVSNYYGINNRLNFANRLGYVFDIADNQKLDISANYTYNSDSYKYNYAYAHNGPNDFIKLNTVGADLEPVRFIPYFFIDKLRYTLNMFSGNVKWSLGDVLSVSGTVRRDGSSAMQVDNRWITSYAGAFDYNLSNHTGWNDIKLSIHGSYGKLPKIFADDRFSAGPVYTSSVGWESQPVLGTYLGYPVITRPYELGWVRWSYPWAYSNKVLLGANIGAFKNRLQVGVDVFNREDKNQIMMVPIAREYGYSSEYRSGMGVNNKGIDVSLFAKIIENNTANVHWTVFGNFSHVKNTLKALPDGMQEIVIGNQKLEIGKPVDAFWVYENNGSYTGSGSLTFNGVAMQAGDPAWVDQNGDNRIDDDDKVLQGNYMPKYFGGFGTNFSYRKMSLDLQFNYVLKRTVLNQYASNRLDFINVENSRDITAVKEITFWELKQDISSYPMYNPWSSVVPYRAEQDLFLDDASFVKLRSATVSYDIVGNSSKTFKKFVFYVTGTNLLTFTKFKGDDPELVTYNGIYDGRGLPLPKTVILGVKIDL